MNITCSALSDTLIESELFGHEPGAFTDARRQKKGLLELAHKGTVLLDEIGEMTAGMQAKVLRFLEEKTFKRVGGSIDIRPDVRVIAATNRDLAEAMRLGQFREDLYYRLSVLPVHLPPLRERREDIEVLVRFLIDGFNREFGKKVEGISREALAQLEPCPWPGNVRELRNTIERAMLLTNTNLLGLADLPFAHPSAGGRFRLPAEGLDFAGLEKDLVQQALDQASGNQTKAAGLLGMNRDQIRYRIEKFGLATGLRESSAPPESGAAGEERPSGGAAGRGRKKS
jgi:transcriptional regulator with PAS, ATPase and Fis domain